MSGAPKDVHARSRSEEASEGQDDGDREHLTDLEDNGLKFS